MKNRLSDSSGWKTTGIALGNIEHRVTIRRLPMRPGDNDTRHRVRLMKIDRRTGEVLINTFRDLDVSKAYRVYEQNVSRLHGLLAD